MRGIRIFNGIVCGLLGLFFFNAGMLVFDLGWVLSGLHEVDNGMLLGFLAVFLLLAAGGFIGVIWLWDVPEARDTVVSRAGAVRFVFGCLQWSVLLWVSLATVGALLLLREDAGWRSPLLWRLASCVPIQLAFLIGCVCWYRHMMSPSGLENTEINRREE